jgi:hypothetical protein
VAVCPPMALHTLRTAFASVFLCVIGATAVAGCAAAPRPAKNPSKAPPKARTYLASSDVRVTEVHFNPSPAQGKAEFIELVNVGAKPAELSGWQVTGAGRVVLPQGTTLNPGQTAILCEDAAALKKVFGEALIAVATFRGKLKKSGETIRLEDPAGKVADEVSYDKKLPAVGEASNTGRSLNRTSFTRDANWTASEPTPGKWDAPK